MSLFRRKTNPKKQERKREPPLSNPYYAYEACKRHPDPGLSYGVWIKKLTYELKI